jgi:hypothetical protein
VVLAVVTVATLAVGPDGAALPNPNTVAVPPAYSCHIVDGLPDRTCTPGSLNPWLTPAQLCAPGFSTSTIRPPASYTDELKKRLMVAYGQVGTDPLAGKPWSPADVELDHLVSLEDLGHPWSPLDLWPQPRRSTGAEPNADEKDQVETAVHRMICADRAHAAEYAARLAATGGSSAEQRPRPGAARLKGQRSKSREARRGGPKGASGAAVEASSAPCCCGRTWAIWSVWPR